MAALVYKANKVIATHYSYWGNSTTTIKMSYTKEGKILRANDGEFITHCFYEPLNQDLALETIAISLASEYGKKNKTQGVPHEDH
jgi:hypothetical protein